MRGGKDAASPRYIWTQFAELTNLIFRKEDEPILDYMDEDGLQIEPECYYPIIPMILVNGAEGIGTGFSTKCPQFNPIDIIKNVKSMINGEEYQNMDPWWSLFDGDVEKVDDTNYIVKGKYEIKDDSLVISELPIGEWTSNYKEFLEKLLENESNKKNKANINFLGYNDNNTDKKIHFELQFKKGYLNGSNDIEKFVKIEKKVNLNNIHLYNRDGTIKKYGSIYDILKEFFDIRLTIYQKRKDYILDKLKNELDLLSYKVKFILAVINKEIKLNNKTKEYIEEKLEDQEFPKLSKSVDGEKNYNYLLGMNLWSLSYEKVEELKNMEKEKQTEYDLLKEKDVKDIWNDELEELLEKYEMWYQQKKEDVEDIVVSKKKVVKKSKKQKNIVV